MCVCVCVSALEAINNQWCDIDRVRLVKQVLRLFLAFNYFIRHSPLIKWMGVFKNPEAEDRCLVSLLDLYFSKLLKEIYFTVDLSKTINQESTVILYNQDETLFK